MTPAAMVQNQSVPLPTVKSSERLIATAKDSVPRAETANCTLANRARKSTRSDTYCHDGNIATLEPNAQPDNQALWTIMGGHDHGKAQPAVAANTAEVIRHTQRGPRRRPRST